MTWVKVCGLTRPEDVEAAVEAGADALGFVMAPGSPRQVSPEQARELGSGAPALRVLVTADLTPGALLRAARAAGADGVQPHGRHAAEAAAVAVATGFVVLRPVPVGERADLEEIPLGQIPLLDTYHPDMHGGTGRRFDWGLIGETERRFVLAGGLGPESVEDAVRRLRPWGVDASSGLEAAPGRKDHAKVAAFVERAKRA